MTRVPEDFLWAAQVCRDLGYREVNLNLGCPSGTVTAKGKGAGMLRDPETLDKFLEAVFARAPLPISVKTRLGFADPEEFPRLLEIFNRYPLRELILHPRVRQEFYSGSVHMDAFRLCMAESNAPVCYNGDLTSLARIQALSREFPRLERVMVGRGLIADPGMFTSGGTDPKALEAFMEELLESYRDAFGSTRNAMFRLKENWRMILGRYPQAKKLCKRLLKTTDVAEYQSITQEFFSRLPEFSSQP